MRKSLLLLFLLAVRMEAAMEIEVKFQLDRLNYDRMVAWMEGLDSPTYAELRECYFDKDDTPFAKSMTDKGYVDALSTLRLRFDQCTAVQCKKVRILDAVTRKTAYREELEMTMTPIEGVAECKKLLAEGYNQTCLEKKRCSRYYMNGRGSFEIVYDVIDGLGQFFEIELKATVVPDAKAGLQIIYDLLREIGITQLTVFDRGYIHMVWNPGFNFGEEVVFASTPIF